MFGRSVGRSVDVRSGRSVFSRSVGWACGRWVGCGHSLSNDREVAGMMKEGEAGKRSSLGGRVL